ncbi:MATE family efflux transporter [Phenylobacterium sp. J367]|uniref:MATE family efflux transporter n=1 Tax=Phenylobacterium sp. J367 TaxID=2898435 RepID=UPI002150A3AF|nr:MATE family efflux transporter [Phenylobacterium sp. J367]MCR5878598.1 MATE family efflux transporter [Phenylobacterium sp. J367]
MSGDRGDLNRTILAIALPAIVTNVATALFGLADMWLIGRLGDAAAQGGVEIGAKFTMTLLIVFNFLRSSTVALTAQAAGRGAEDDQAATLTRGVAVALLVGAVLLCAWPVTVTYGLQIFDAAGGVSDQARTYADIRYVGGVAWLVNCVLTGWLIGRRRMRTVLAVEVAANLVHIALDVAFVLGFGWGVAGVATATLLSETLKLVALLAVVAREAPARRALALVRVPDTWRPAELGALFRLNRDLFLRTLLLMGATVLLTRSGAQQGPAVLAANAILYQLFMLQALILDGFESSTQVLTGESVGARDRARFGAQLRANLAWSGAGAVLIALVFLVAGGAIAASFSTDPAVVATVRTYAVWAVVLPLAGTVSFIFDGVMIGASWTRAMVISMAAALAGFVLMRWLATPLGNHGLWLAFSLFFVLRAAGQAALLPGLVRRTFSPPG